MSKKNKIRVGVIGVGYLGQHHARIYSEMADSILVGVTDVNMQRCQEIAAKYGCQAFDDYRDMFLQVDAVSIVVPTVYHYTVAMDAIQEGKDLLIEKPITSTVVEAEKLIEEADNRGCVLQVGHLERFNSGLIELSKMVDNPTYIESQRLAPFVARGIDVDVTVDLMIHDIDIILSLVHSEIADLKAQGIKVITDNIDLAHAWVEFKNGCVAVVSASRISSVRIRSLKVFQHDKYMELNYQTHEIAYYGRGRKHMEQQIKKTEIKEPLKEELLSFIQCSRERKRPLVSGYEGKEALKVALKISEVVKNGNTNG
ncbi:MAG TPA: Gfo/Idh/MocA family oxidoreductase [Thermodesulfovibrionia bacterium]|nr:Gfo/Idh/MocA family oxidoreductase [Thermodesulfovibrionia bacterium]